MPAVTPAEVHTSPSRDEDRVGVDGDRRVGARERVAPGPVRRGPAAVEQAGRGEQERAGAHGRDAPRPRRAGDPGGEASSAVRRPRPGAARDDERVDRAADLVELEVGTIGSPLPVASGSRVGAATRTS